MSKTYAFPVQKTWGYLDASGYFVVWEEARDHPEYQHVARPCIVLPAEQWADVQARAEAAEKRVKELEARIDRDRDAVDVLLSAGFVRCDIPACNCNSWHHVGGLRARFDEIKEAFDNADINIDRNGKTLLTVVKDTIARIAALESENATLSAAFDAAMREGAALAKGKRPLPEWVSELIRRLLCFHGYYSRGSFETHNLKIHEMLTMLLAAIPAEARKEMGI